MLAGYIRIALRNLAKYRLYAFINITGLALGLAIFLFSFMLVQYEYNHDGNFVLRERIFMVGSKFAPASGEPIGEYPGVRSAYGPLLEREIPELEQVVRSIQKKRLLSLKQGNFYQTIRFTDPGFTRVFNFQYIHGNSKAMNDPRGLLLTASTAKRLFGRVNVLGEPLTLEHKYKMFVAAVIKDLPPDSHFTADYRPNYTLTAVASLQALVELEQFNQAGIWSDNFENDATYILLPRNKDRAWLQAQVDGVFARFTPAPERKYISGLIVRPLVEANTQMWESMNFPMLTSVRLLGLLVLIIAIVNYTNLAAAQSFGRTLEVGLRKTFGANRSQLLTQFLVESLTLSAFAMILALAAIELLIPAYNDWLGKGVKLNYLSTLPWLLLITIAVGLLAGAYPAFLISRINPIESLHNTFLTGRKGGFFRGLMVAVQFAISIFILALVMIIFFQNRMLFTKGNNFPGSQILVLAGMDSEGIKAKRISLGRELSNLDGVQNISFSGGIPFHDNSQFREVHDVTNQGDDKNHRLKLTMISVDARFMETYDIPLLAGRSFHENTEGDVFQNNKQVLNIILNQLAAGELGLGKNIIGKSFYSSAGTSAPRPRKYTVIGLMPDQYFKGMHTKKIPLAFFIKPELHSFASIRLRGTNRKQTESHIDQVWRRVIQNYPIRRSPLESYSNLFFNLLKGINAIIAFFAGVAMLLALIGLFGLAAFMSRLRTKEIGIRKVMGASVFQILRLLIWQISRPVLWSMVIAMPLAYFSSSLYLDFFPERIGFIIPVILLAGLVAILSAWAIVAGQALKIAGANPIDSLRYE